MKTKLIKQAALLALPTVGISLVALGEIYQDYKCKLLTTDRYGCPEETVVKEECNGYPCNITVWVGGHWMCVHSNGFTCTYEPYDPPAESRNYDGVCSWNLAFYPDSCQCQMPVPPPQFTVIWVDVACVH